MRSIASGRFLYLDSDTIIMKPPDEIWKRNCDIAASPDLGQNGKPYLFGGIELDAFAEPRRVPSSRFNLNSGVIYFAIRGGACRGRTISFEMAGICTGTGKASDQAAFNLAIQRSDARLEVLPLAYNAQIAMNVTTIAGAKIVHFFTGGFENSEETVAHTLAKRLKSNGVLDEATIHLALASGNPLNVQFVSEGRRHEALPRRLPNGISQTG